MSISGTEIVVAIIMVAIAYSLVILFLKYKDDTSERRLKKMLLRCGLNPETIEQGDTEIIIREVRARCHKCQTEDVCERWLDGQETGENTFCPNAETFEALAKNT